MENEEKLRLQSQSNSKSKNFLDKFMQQKAAREQEAKRLKEQSLQPKPQAKQQFTSNKPCSVCLEANTKETSKKPSKISLL